MPREFIKIALPPYVRINIRQKLMDRMMQMGISPGDFSSIMIEDINNQQPTIYEIIEAAVRLNITEIQFLQNDKSE